MLGRRLDTTLLSLALLLACVAAAGCGEGSEPSQPASEADPAQVEQRPDEKKGKDGDSSQSSSITQSGEGGSGGNQSSSIVQRSGSGSSSSQSSSSSGGVQTLSGDGESTLSFNVEKPSRLAWTNAEGKPFSARGAGISISSSEGRGEIPLDTGRYDDVRVRGSTWTIVIRPR